MDVTESIQCTPVKHVSEPIAQVRSSVFTQHMNCQAPDDGRTQEF